MMRRHLIARALPVLLLGACLLIQPSAAMAVTEINLLPMTAKPRFDFSRLDWGRVPPGGLGDKNMRFGTLPGGLTHQQVALEGRGALALVPGTRSLWGDLRNMTSDPSHVPLVPDGEVWLTNPRGATGRDGFRTGRGPITVLFRKGMCAVGFRVAQSGAIARYFGKRSKLSLRFFNIRGQTIDTQDRWPGGIHAQYAFAITPREAPIAGVTFEDEAPNGFGLIFVVADPCSIPTS